MIGLRRSRFPAALAALSAVLFSVSSSAQEAQELFRQGVELLDRGENEAALAIFQRVLAADPGHDEAFALWQETDDRIWMKLLVLEGEYEQVAKRLMSLAQMGRKQRQNDPEAIRALLTELDTDDVGARTRAIRTLAADYGEYAVPLMVFGLADKADDDRRVILMQALTQMGSDVVPPLLETLESEDPFLRRNVALTLGYIGDPRASGLLALHAASDEDEGVRSAATQALQRTGGTADALTQLLAQGDAYHNELDTVLRPYQFSDVVWSWDGAGLVATEVPRYLYGDELAKKAYYRALRVAPDSLEALAGVARVSVSQRQHIAEWAGAGQDVGEWSERLTTDELAVRIAGGPALDLALGWAIDQDDQTAATGLCRALAHAGGSSTPNLTRALGAGDSGAVRGEAAVALGWIACHSHARATPDVVTALAQAASREIVRIAAIIDGDAARRAQLEQALESEGILVNAWSTGGRALASLRSVPGIDVIVLAESLPDLTAHQVLTEVRADPRFGATPVILAAEDVEAAGELWSERVTAISAYGDTSAVLEALSGAVEGDRAEASDLAARAATVLACLGAGSTDISSSSDPLASALGRPDEVVVPSLQALGHGAGAGHVDAIAAVVTDTARSEPVRVAAGNSLNGVFARVPQASEATVTALTEVAINDASFPVREAVATALGRLPLDAEARVRLMNAVRAKLALRRPE